MIRAQCNPDVSPPDPIFSILIQFSGKIGQIIGWHPLLELAPPSGKSWISPCDETTQIKCFHCFSLPYCQVRVVDIWQHPITNVSTSNARHRCCFRHVVTSTMFISHLNIRKLKSVRTNFDNKLLQCLLNINFKPLNYLELLRTIMSLKKNAQNTELIEGDTHYTL